MQTECTPKLFELEAVERHSVVAGFDGGNITSNAGALLLGQVDRGLGLVRRFADCFIDRRDPRYVEHQVETLVGQRIFGFAMGYEDLNDHDELRKDPTFAVLAGKLHPVLRTDCEPLAGKSTLNRLEHTPWRHASNAQFEHINAEVKAFQGAGEPVISVDTKKKELVGDFKNAGRELRPKGQPEPVRVHDFVIPELGKMAPYGVYDVAANDGWVNLGISHDTAAFAVASIRRWWHVLGAARYPTAKRLLINADCGGSNGNRVRLWKRELQVLADELGIAITVNHLPPGTSKWNRIEHKLFAFITMNWRAKPLVSYLAIIQLIASTTTETGLTVACQLDSNAYEKGIKVSDEEMP